MYFDVGGEMMDDEQPELDRESQLLLAELWETPVGRRWVLKAGLGSAVAVGALHASKGSAEAAAKPRRRRSESAEFHFVLGHLRGVSRLTLVANGQRFALVRHTRASREALRRRGGPWAVADLSKLTHHVSGVRLPADQGILVSVHGHRGRRVVLAAQMWHVPRATTIRLARLSHRATGSFRHVLPSSHRLEALGIKPAQVRLARQVAELATIVDPDDLAISLVGLHPNVATKNPANLLTTTNLLGATKAVKDFGSYIQKLTGQGKDVMQLAAAKNSDGSAAQISIPIVQNGTVVGHDITGFSTWQLNPQKDRGFTPALSSAVKAGISAVRNSASLGSVINQPLDQDPAASTQTWVQPQGVIPQSRPASTSSHLEGAGFSPQVKNTGFLFGTQTDVDSFTPTSVDLTLYNNFVRWVWVYVQYLGKDNENLSANPSATWPDTKYSQSLGLLPQVFTVLGVPLWDTNYIKVTLNFPQGAHTARLLFCGLGSNLEDGGWRQYFPSDAYPDAIAPQDEVLFSSLFTGIATIGLTVFALATDIDIASTWAEIKTYITNWFLTADLSLLRALTRSLIQTGAEVLAVSVAGGVATHDSIAANGGSTENIWSLLLPLASAIPKMLFAPGAAPLWLALGGIIGGNEGADKVLNAIPIFGQVFAVVTAVGDAVTLAEVCAETIVAPWVIENEVALTYPATITVNRDPRDSSFPKTARSYQLEAKVDGGLVFDPLTGAVNPGGVAQPGPLVVSVTAPFGGEKIQWSVVFLNSRGQQVGTGVSAQFTNNDPNNVPSAVPITITELEVPIDSLTVFKRTVTTGYSSAAGGYTWSGQIVDTGTVASSGIQQVASTSISTLAGVAGVVWEQGNRFYIRGVPVAQSGATISLGKATTEGYSRRPFLLFDAFVGRLDQGNHVLLEPDASTSAYNVRKVSLDPTTGAPSWDSTVSYGTFPLPVSAAALHSSGRVVAVHTDSGRFAWLKPVNVPNPVLAAYSAGAGTQVGLLGSPIAIAVTNPGTVLVLEAAGAGGLPQLAAFDLNGNPVPYFQPPLTRRSLVAGAGRRRGATGQGQYTLPLVSAGTYLDLAVDGAGQIYLLYHTGDGSAPGQYRVDVYTPTGAVLDTHSPGVNVPHLAIDYWRSIYAANYDPLIDIATKKPHIDPALGVAEPSLSRFDPEELIGRKPPKKPKHKPKHRRPKKHE